MRLTNKNKPGDNTMIKIETLKENKNYSIKTGTGKRYMLHFNEWKNPGEKWELNLVNEDFNFIPVFKADSFIACMQAVENSETFFEAYNI